MKHAVRFAIAVVAVVLVASGASAQTLPIGSVQIDFKFMAAGKAMPAGNYRFEASGNSVTLRSGTGDSASLPVITRLGRHDNDMTIEVVFDVLKGERMLSEVWPPAGSDGYCLATNTAQHTHYVIGGSKPSK